MLKMIPLMFMLMVIEAGTFQVHPLYRKQLDLKDDQNATDKYVCETKECVSTAARILQSLDSKIDPCDDFYQFACGGWIDSQMIPPHRYSMQSLYDVDIHLASVKRMLSDNNECSNLTAVKKAKDLFTSCLKYTKTSEVDNSIVKIITNRFGEWPLAVDNWNEHAFDLTDFLIKAARLNVHPLIRLEMELMSTVVNETLVLKHEMVFKIPDFGLPIQNYPDDNLIFKIYVVKVFNDLIRFGVSSTAQAIKDVADIVEVEKTLIKMIHRREEKTTTTYTLQEFQKQFGVLMNWTNFITTIVTSPKIGITDVTDQEAVLTTLPEYLANMTEYFSKLPVRTQANYIVYRVIDSFGTDLRHEHNKIKNMLDQVIYGITANPSPEAYCVNYVSQTFKLVVHRLLYTDKLPPEELKTVNSMLERIRDEFDAMLSENDWIDETTLKFIREKNAVLSNVLVDYEMSMNDTVLEDYYLNVTVFDDDFLENAVIVREEAFARNIRLLRKPYERLLELLPYDFMAWNIINFNKIHTSSIVFEPPIFTCNVPMSINYGGLGIIFAHEIIHSQDNLGLEFNKWGTQGAWWSNESLPIYIQRQQCIVEQYNHFFNEDAGTFINGSLTLDENIADCNGMKLAYRAYKKYLDEKGENQLRLPGVDFSNDQLFFINYAQMWCEVQTKEAAKTNANDEHCPGKFRVIGSIQNSKDFARAFKCPVGSFMNPEKKCEVW